MFYRHAAPGRDAFAGGSMGRWGKTFPVMGLGYPAASVTVEAYRHLVEPFGIPPSAVQPRVFYTVSVQVETGAGLYGVRTSGIRGCDRLRPDV